MDLEKMADILVEKEIREEKRIKDIVEAFEDFIKASNEFDIVYSKKFGYVWVDDEVFGSGPITKPEYLLESLINQVAEDMLSEKMRRDYKWDAMPEFITYLEKIFETMGQTGEFCRGYFAALNKCGNLEKEYYRNFREVNDDEE